MGFFSRKNHKPWEDLENFELPHFPGTTLTTLEVLRDESSDGNTVAEALGQDPGLSVRVLRMVNSSEFGTRTQVDDLAHACQLVGLSALEALVISVAVPEALPQDIPGFNSKRFWAASQRRGAVARALSNVLRPSKAAVDFTSSLLSHMAVPLLAARLGEPYVTVVDSSRQGRANLVELEQSAFGWDHAEAGGWMAEKWQLPQVMADSIRAQYEDAMRRDPVALASMLDLNNPDKDAERVAECASEEWDVDPAVLVEAILEALGGT